MSWRNRLSWRWIIRGTCLGLLLFCAALWGLGYFYGAGVSHVGNSSASVASVQVGRGRLRVTYLSGFDVSSQIGRGNMGSPAVRPRVFFGPRGWRIQAFAIPASTALRDAGSLGFTVGSVWQFGPDYRVDVPLGSASAFLGVVSWIAWRLTRQSKPGRGFPIEPLASRPEIADR